MSVVNVAAPHATASMARRRSPLDWRSVLLLALFFGSLQQLTVPIGVANVYVGYLFLLLLIIPLRPIIATESAAVILAVYSVIFVVGAPRLLTEDTYYSLRVCASYFVFMAPLTLLLVKFEKHDLEWFKRVVLVAAVYYALSKLFIYVLTAGFLSVFTLKAIVGSQRYGFVLLLAFFLAIYSRSIHGLTRAAVIGLILFGCLLTFSRATVVALVGAGMLAIVSSVNWDMRIRLRRLRWATVARAAVILACATAIAIYAARPLLDFWTFIDTRLIAPFLSGELLIKFLSSSYQSSEGARAYLTALIFEYLAEHPWTGSNYAGLYLLYDQLNGVASTHNQFTDVLLRTGALGFALYLWLVFRILQFFRHDKGIFFGLVAILIYGLFHETFKLSHGGFIFGFLLSYQYWMRRQPVPRNDETRAAVPTRL